MAGPSKATLAIYSVTGTASHVTEVLGLTPTSAIEKHDIRVRHGREHAPFKRSGWFYEPDESKLDPDDPTGFAALRALVADIRHLSSRLATLRPEYDTVIRWKGEASLLGEFAIDADLLGELGQLGCELRGTVYIGSTGVEWPSCRRLRESTVS